MAQVDCGSCPHTLGCPAGHCSKARAREHKEAVAHGQLALPLPPARKRKAAPAKAARKGKT